MIDKDDDRCTMTVLAGSATISSNHSDQASKMPLNFMFGGISGDKLFNNDKLYCLPADQGLMLSFEKGGFYETACEERSGSRRMNGMELYRYVFSAKDYTMEIRVGKCFDSHGLISMHIVLPICIIYKIMINITTIICR